MKMKSFIIHRALFLIVGNHQPKRFCAHNASTLQLLCCLPIVEMNYETMSCIYNQSCLDYLKTFYGMAMLICHLNRWHFEWLHRDSWRLKPCGCIVRWLGWSVATAISVGVLGIPSPSPSPSSFNLHAYTIDVNEFIMQCWGRISIHSLIHRKLPVQHWQYQYMHAFVSVLLFSSSSLSSSFLANWYCLCNSLCCVNHRFDDSIHGAVVGVVW